MKGEGGRVSFAVGCETVVVCFCFGGREASQLPGCEGGRGRVSFGVGLSCSAGNGGESASGGAKGGESALELGVKLLLSVFVLGGRGASQLPGCEGGRGASQLQTVAVCFCFGGAGGQSASGL